VPEQFPTLQGKYGPMLATEGKIVPSCIHCHQIGDAQRQIYRDRKGPIPENLLFSYPHPKTIGLILDPKERSTVLRVLNESPAESAGLRAGDVILKLEGQPLLSMADVQWVLHQTPAAGADLKFEVQRGERKESLKLKLPKDWRQRDDLSWRASTWGLRRMALGGLLLEALGPEGRKQTEIPDSTMALRIKHVGQYGPHAAAQNAGFRKDDLVVSFDGRTDLLRETDVLAYALTNRKAGERVPVTVLRGGKMLKLMLPMQH
jgi:S1-C subfamily serine protease